MFSELINSGLTQDEIAEKLCNRVNELADLATNNQLEEDDIVAEI